MLFEDESRVGTKTIVRRRLARRGKDCRVLTQHKFECNYLWNAVNPITGQCVWGYSTHCNTETFQWFLNELSQTNPEKIKLVVLDNAGWHKAKDLVIPPNIRLLFLPAYSPELNPTERVWEEVKRPMANLNFNSWDSLLDFTIEVVSQMTDEFIQQVAGFQWIKKIGQKFNLG